MKLINNIIVSLMTCLLLITCTGVSVVSAEESSEPSATYNATFEFVSSDDSNLPKEVTDLLPERMYDLPVGETVEAKHFDDVSVDKFVYHFVG